MNLNTYLNFNGDCRAAFDFYRSVFGGDFTFLVTFADGPSELPPLSDAEKTLIMHVSLPVGDNILMGSDNISAFGPPSTVGSNFSISIGADSRADTDRLVNGLAAGGAVLMPPDDMFWGAYFGMCRDRFGVNWMVSHEPAQE